jgi:hypothetical protein
MKRAPVIPECGHFIDAISIGMDMVPHGVGIICYVFRV